MIDAQGAKKLFFFSESTTYLNHGGYGVAPREVMEFRAKKQAEIEKNPTTFLAHEYSSTRQTITAFVAKRFSVNADELALIDNITDGANAVLRAFPLATGDEILTTTLTYGAIQKAAVHIAGKQGAHVKKIELPFPNPNPQEYVEAIRQAITSKTKLAVLDHITSGTALVLPIAEMTKVCRERGVAVLVDGAHAPGHIALDIKSIDADWYVANLHKWYFVPRGCGFLWAAPHRQQDLLPNVLSWDIEKPFPSSFEWTGTRDPSGWLSIPAAFDFMDRFGEENMRRNNHALIREGMNILAEACDVRITTPDAMIGSMGIVPLPDGLPFAPTEEGRKQIEQRLQDEYDITVSPSFADKERIWLRVSAQIYNNANDYRKLAGAINDMRSASFKPAP